MRLWLDDIRPMPKDYDRHCLTSREALHYVLRGEVTHISFDHDLGSGFFAKTGYYVASEIERLAWEGKIEPITWDIHSANPVGRKNIQLAMESADKAWQLNIKEKI